MIFNFVLILTIFISSISCKVKRPKTIPIKDNTKPTTILTNEKIVELQLHKLTFHVSVTKNALNEPLSLELSVEADHFTDNLYLAVGFSETGAMVPAMALAGWMSRPQSEHETPVGHCNPFWLSQRSGDGIDPIDLRQTAIDKCVLQRGYGTVALQTHVHLATNKRLANEKKNQTDSDGSFNSIVLPIDDNGIRLIFAIGPASSSGEMPLQFHNENYGSFYLEFDGQNTKTIELTTNVLIHGSIMIVVAALTLLRVFGNNIGVGLVTRHDRLQTGIWKLWHSGLFLRILFIIGVGFVIYHVQSQNETHFVDLHGVTGLLLLAFVIAGPRIWMSVLSWHVSLKFIALFACLSQVVLGLRKVQSFGFWMFAASLICFVMIVSYSVASEMSSGRRKMVEV